MKPAILIFAGALSAYSLGIAMGFMIADATSEADDQPVCTYIVTATPPNIGRVAAQLRAMPVSRTTTIGFNVPVPPHDDTTRVGSGSVFLEMDRRGARIVGTRNIDTAAQAVMAGLIFAEQQLDILKAERCGR